MKAELTGSEAVFGFCGWLTSRDMNSPNDRVIMSPIDEIGQIPDLIQQFCDANNLPEPRDGWGKNLIHPV